MIRFFSLLCLIGFFSSGFILPKPGKKFTAPKAFVFVPSGTYTEGADTFAMKGFYMMSREVTNIDYKEFLFYLKSKGREEAYEKASVRSEGWLAVSGRSLETAPLYYNHPQFEEYPVVNITQEGARLYCQFLKEALEIKYTDFVIEARLPTEKEWMYAAQGGISNAPYPHGYHLRDRKGVYLYNFKMYGDESIHEDPVTRELIIKPSKKDIPASDDFWGPGLALSATPNGFGLYHTSGNVAEMIEEEGRTKGGSFNNTGYDIRIDAPDPYAGFKDASPFIGFRVLFTVKEK